MIEYASKGTAAAGLATGIIGTALGTLNTLGSGLLGNGNGTGRDININAPDVEVARHRRHVTHYELELVKENAEKTSKIYFLEEMAKNEARYNEKFLEIERRFAYDEKLIEKNRCEIEKVDAYGKCNYYKTDRVIRPWDICPPIATADVAVQSAKAKATA